MQPTDKQPYDERFFIPAAIQDYTQVPVYRRRWLVVVMMLVFIPGLLAVVLSGEVYLQNQKTKAIYQFTARQKKLVTFLGVTLLIINIIRLL